MSASLVEHRQGHEGYPAVFQGIPSIRSFEDDGLLQCGQYQIELTNFAYLVEKTANFKSARLVRALQKTYLNHACVLHEKWDICFEGDEGLHG